jgi:hypothetical protein
MDRRTVALGLAAVAAVAVAAIVTVSGRGGGESAEHKAIAGYIDDVGVIQQKLRAPLTRTMNAYRSFASTRVASAAEQRRLVAAEGTLQTLRGRLARLPAPAPARRLRALLLELVDAEVATSHEVAQLAVFTPHYAALLGQSRQASTRLAKALNEITPPKPHQIKGTKAEVARAQAAFTAASSEAAGRQADAIDTYGSAIAALERRLRKLHPPEVLRPSYRAQLRTLEKSQAAGAALAAELRKSDRSRVAVLGRRFTVAARTAGSVDVQKAQIAAVKAYNTRVRAIGTMQGRISNELSRLQQQSG